MLSIFFFNDTATTEIYTLSLHDALPICGLEQRDAGQPAARGVHVVTQRQPVHRPEHHLLRPVRLARPRRRGGRAGGRPLRSEEHTSELQSRQYLVCRLSLEKKKNSLTYN